MNYFNYNAVLIINNKEYYLTEDEVNSTEIAEIKWRDKNRPPMLLCRRIVIAIRDKYKNALVSSQREQLAAQILGVSNILFAEMMMMGTLDHQLRAERENAFDHQAMHQEWQDAQAKTGRKIPRKEFEEYFKNKRRT